jgi:hypothetical protein
MRVMHVVPIGCASNMLIGCMINRDQWLLLKIGSLNSSLIIFQISVAQTFKSANTMKLLVQF